jgi:hypothetical protein
MLDITTLAPWGEFIGAIAVVLSLVYLAGQIRQNSRQMQIATTVSLGESDIELYRMIVDDPELTGLFRKGAEDRDSLSEIERDRFDAWTDMMMRVFQRNYFVAQDGALKPALWQGERRANAGLIQQPGSQQWWNENRLNYSDEFGRFLDGLICEGEAAE